MTRIEGFHEIPPYMPEVETLFDLSDLAHQFGDDYLLRILEDIAQSDKSEDESI